MKLGNNQYEIQMNNSGTIEKDQKVGKFFIVISVATLVYYLLRCFN